MKQSDDTANHVNDSDGNNEGDNNKEDSEDDEEDNNHNDNNKDIYNSIKAASFHPGTMCNTKASINCSIGTPLKAASLDLSTMRDANSSEVAKTFSSSLDGSICTSLVAATFLLPSLCGFTKGNRAISAAPLQLTTATHYLSTAPTPSRIWAPLSPSIMRYEVD